MTMRRKLLILAIAALGWSLSAAETRVIALSSDAVPAERTAARELQRFIAAMTGEELPVVVDDRPEGPAILVGQSPEIAALLNVDFERMRPDEISVRSAGDKLVVTGARPRGTLYAAYSLLEEVWGVEFWTPLETDVPQKSILNYDGIDLNYAPPFQIRDVYSVGSLWAYSEFAARLRSNGSMSAASEEYGGEESVLGFCHTFDRILPAAELLGSHPEWFSLVNGVRVGGLSTGQLCLSNREMRAEFIRRAGQWLTENPWATVISISQNDTKEQYCQCPECLRLTEREQGRQSGVLLDFVNEVAIALEALRPGVQIETLAYNYTLEPPLVTMPRSNVIIRLCVVDANVGFPLESGVNASFDSILTGWARVCDKIAVWQYLTNFWNYFLPQPNLRAMVRDFNYFRHRNIVSVFAQGDALSSATGGDLVPLRTWLTAKLLWNPDLDPHQLIRRFLNGYYGAAAPHLLRYLDIIHGELDRTPTPIISFYMNDTDGWLSMEALLEARRATAAAREAVRHDPVLSGRVALAGCPIEYALLLRSEVAEAPERYGFTFEQLQALATATLAVNEADDPACYREGGRFANFAMQIRARYRLLPSADPAELPEALRDVDPAKAAVLKHKSFQVFEVANQVTEIEDPAALGGWAWRHSTGHRNWNIQHDLGSFAGTWRIYAVVRLETANGQQAEGPAVLLGIYSGPNSGDGIFFDARQWPDAGYRCVDLGEYELGGKDIFYSAPVPNPAVTGIVVDRLVLVRP